MKTLRLPLAALTASALALSAMPSQATTATTDPVGFVTVEIAAGTGTAKRNTLFSIPLQETDSITGQAAGIITAVTANTLSNANAGWAPGELSHPATPYLIQVTSGAATGRMFLIASSATTGGAIAGAANTASTVTVSSLDTAQVDLTALGIQAGTDTYKIYACDTLSSFFGAPATTGIAGGASSADADTVTIVLNGTPATFWYNTSVNPQRWSRVGPGSPDASNVALLPNYGVQYGRLPATPLSFVITGQVPTVDRSVAIKNSGATVLSQYWPVESTLASLGLQSLPGWLSGASAAVADTVVVTSGGSATTFYYDGSDWRRVGPGSPISNTNVIGIGTSLRIDKKGNAAGFSALNQEVPYNLN